MQELCSLSLHFVWGFLGSSGSHCQHVGTGVVPSVRCRHFYRLSAHYSHIQAFNITNNVVTRGLLKKPQDFGTACLILCNASDASL